jgi:expansin (peptidoglycan-binding protein)
MRRFAFVAIPFVLLVACSSTDDGLGTDPDGGSSDASTGRDGASADASSTTAVEASVDDGGAADAAPVMEFSGEATYYAADGTGACGFKATPSDLNVAAMNGSQYKKALCGQCVLVTGPKGMVKVRIVDLCPGCAQGGLDLSKQAFAAISPLSAGRIKIKWHFVPC